MFEKCSKTVQKIFKKYSKTVQKIFENYSKNVRKIFEKCSKTDRKMFQSESYDNFFGERSNRFALIGKQWLSPISPICFGKNNLYH
jgi:uncharacterized protein YaaN involved in tellurite resistance